MDYKEYHRRMAIINRRVMALCERWNNAKTDAIAKAINAEIGLELSIAEDYSRRYTGIRLF